MIQFFKFQILPFNPQISTLNLVNFCCQKPKTLLITQPVAIQNKFIMSYFDSINQWSKLDTKNQSANPAKMNFPTVIQKIRKKIGHVDIHLFYQ